MHRRTGKAVQTSVAVLAIAHCRFSSCRRGAVTTYAAKELHFNKNGEALKRMQAGVDKLATVVGVTLGPKVSIPAG